MVCLFPNADKRMNIGILRHHAGAMTYSESNSRHPALGLGMAVQPLTAAPASDEFSTAHSKAAPWQAVYLEIMGSLDKLDDALHTPGQALGAELG